MLVVSSGLAIADGLLFLGQAVPLIGETCKVARTILGNVQKLAKKVDDVVTMGERVVDTLQLLDKMKGNIARIGADNAVLDRWQALHTVLVDIIGTALASPAATPAPRHRAHFEQQCKEDCNHSWWPG